MSNAPTQRPIPRQVDPRKFAQQGICLAGNLAISALSRLVDMLAEIDGDVVVDLAFALDEQKIKVLTGRVDAQVKMSCQRCLDPVTLDLHCTLSLAIVGDEEDAKQLPGHLEPWIASEGVADLYEVIEEELLLALPMAAFHDTACVEPSLFSCGEPEEGEEEESAKNPFQVLQELKDLPKS